MCALRDMSNERLRGNFFSGGTCTVIQLMTLKLSSRQQQAIKDNKFEVMRTSGRTCSVKNKAYKILLSYTSLKVKPHTARREINGRIIIKWILG
jgi:hypothetical protein